MWYASQRLLLTLGQGCFSYGNWGSCLSLFIAGFVSHGLSTCLTAFLGVARLLLTGLFLCTVLLLCWVAVPGLFRLLIWVLRLILVLAFIVTLAVTLSITLAVILTFTTAIILAWI